MKFCKYHALGNDYIVLEPTEGGRLLTGDEIRLLCHRNYGIGSDGILWGPERNGEGKVRLRIFNPDGSEAEKSGNGLRIFARYLWDARAVGSEPFEVVTAGGTVRCEVFPDGSLVRVEMGRVSFWSDAIPVAGERREVLNEKLRVGSREVGFCAATVGNPHCVVLLSEISAGIARELGPLLETHPIFPRRTNVQFMKVMDRKNLAIEIWERGAGYTLASGSSSSAAASVAHRLGLVESCVSVHMPGGTLAIEIGADYSVVMTGPVTKVCSGETAAEAFRTKIPG